MSICFNEKSKTNNSINASLFSLINQIIKIGLEFLFRTIFLSILSKEYLGLNGLFSNVLSVLSIAELGIGTIIVYKLYKPIKDKNIKKIGQYMNFYKIVYSIIALIIFIIGISLLPFLNFFIKDASEIPPNINLNAIYLLFLFKSLSSYFFVYKQSLLRADQRNDLISIIQIITNIISYAAQIVTLLVTKNYVVVLTCGIFTQIFINMMISYIITIKYKEIFCIKENISKEEKNNILKDAYAMLCHKIGNKVVYATDNLLMSSFIGISVLAIYSNYSMIISGVNLLVTQIFSSFISSIGMLHIEGNIEKEKNLYFNLLFMNLWLSSICVIADICLLSPFIVLWQGNEYVLSQNIVYAICASQFLTISRTIDVSFISATGLFNKDKYRPLIEAMINLCSSIIFVKLFGVIGIFLGTIFSSLCTVTWRIPHILFKNEFKSGLKDYWKMFFKFVIITIFIVFILSMFINKISNTLLGFIIKTIVVLIISNLILILLTYKQKYFKYWYSIIIKLKAKLIKF